MPVNRLLPRKSVRAVIVGHARQQLAIFHAYHNFVLPHASLRLPIPEAEMSCKTGSIKSWRQQTPAMAAGLTDRLWTLREVLLFRVPPWPQPQVS